MSSQPDLTKQARAVIQKVFAHEDHFGNWMGYEVVGIKPGQITISLKIEERHLSPSGAAHGGVLAALVDSAMGFALFTKLPDGAKCSTIEFKINYFSPVQVHETIFGHATIKF